MKNFLTVFILFLSLLSIGQDYKLFDANSNKLYTTDPIPGLTSGLTFDSVIMTGDFSVYFNYTGIGNELESDTCVFWGGSTCLQQDKPSWLGYAITLDFMGTYHFKTYQDNFLSFNFNLLPGDSSLFYQDASQFFYIVFEGTDSATILNIPDSAKYYRISNYDLSGNTINSPLNNEQIIIGKDMGLVGFFRIDSFPLVQQPISLIGNLSPAAGFISLTNEMVFDHHVGDEIQYLDQYIYLDGPPFFNYKNYIKHIFLDRTDLPDSIYYTIERTTYKTDSNLVILDTINLKYERNKIIAEIPFDKLDQDHNLVLSRLFAADYCELNLWTYSREPQYLVYCPADNCWGNYDIPGPPPDEETIYVCGLGLYLDKFAITGPPPVGYSHIYKIIYFKKDGIECGEEVIVNVNEALIPASSFTVIPNPVSDNSKIVISTSPAGKYKLEIYNETGILVKRLTGLGYDQLELNKSEFRRGIYFFRVTGSDQRSYSGKFIVN